MSSVLVHRLQYHYPECDDSSLHDLSFVTESPHSLSIVGGNLAGKTTLANTIVRKHLGQLQGQLHGELRLTFNSGGNDLIGFIFDDVNWIFCNLYVDEEVAFGLENLGVDPPKIRKRVKDILSLTGLDGFERRQINTLSGGEQQKLAIATMLAAEPDILITDDLLSSIDVASSGTLLEVLDQYRQGTDCCWIDLTRKWSEHSSISSQVAVMKDGTLQRGGTPYEMISRWGEWLMAQGDVELPEILEILVVGNQVLVKRNLPSIEMAIDHSQIRERFLRRFRPNARNAVIESRTSNPIIEVNKISFQYSGDSFVLSDCDLAIVPESINVLAGRNGSGKSTLAKLLAGLVKPKTGQILWRGARRDTKFLRSKIFLVFQEPYYHFISDTVHQELLITGRLSSLSDLETKKEIAGTLSTLGLQDKADQNPLNLTKGEQRRLAIGIALIKRPEVLIVDEPTLGQDKTHTATLGMLFKRLISEGMTVIIVSHDSRFIFEYGETIHLLEKGAVSYSGSIPPLFERSRRSDFSGQSEVLNLWQDMEDRRLSVAPPRSVKELFESIEAKPNGYQRFP